MTSSEAIFRRQVNRLLGRWRDLGPPPRWQLRGQLEELLQQRRNLGVNGLWSIPPLLVTATLDDGWGVGIETVALAARALGMRHEALGLLVSPTTVAATCRRLKPEFLAMTVLQVETEEALRWLADQIADSTTIIVGGAFVRNRPTFFARPNWLAAADIKDFIGLMVRHSAWVRLSAADAGH